MERYGLDGAVRVQAGAATPAGAAAARTAAARTAAPVRSAAALAVGLALLPIAGACRGREARPAGEPLRVEREATAPVEVWLATRGGRVVSGALVIPLGEESGLSGLDLSSLLAEDGEIHLSFEADGTCVLQPGALDVDADLAGEESSTLKIDGEGVSRVRLGLEGR
jgi:hypothetical protein